MNRRIPNYIPKTFFDAMHPTRQKLTEVSDGIKLPRIRFSRAVQLSVDVTPKPFMHGS